MSASDGAAGAAAVGDVVLADELVRLRQHLAALIASGAADSIPDESIDALLTMAVKLFVAAQQAADEPLPPFAGSPVDPPDVILIINQLLRVANVDPFELALWNAWGKA